MPSHSEGPGIWLSVWRFLLTHCLYERAAAIRTKFSWRGPNKHRLGTVSHKSFDLYFVQTRPVPIYTRRKYLQKSSILGTSCRTRKCPLFIGTLLVATEFARQKCSYAKGTCAASSEFVSSSIPSWQISTAHAQPFRGARDLVFCLKVPFDSVLVWASSEGSGETARMRRLAWTFAARIGDKYQIRLTRSNCNFLLRQVLSL